MCGRYSITCDALAFEKHFDALMTDEIFLPNYNASPSSLLPIISMKQPNLAFPARWGFATNWETGVYASRQVINARQETIKQKKMFSQLYNTKRCLIPADGFYEWQKNANRKQPFRFTLKNDEMFSFAGLYQVSIKKDAVDETSFVILTTNANDLVGNIHNRMPVILDKKKQQAWLELTLDELEEVFEPYPSCQMKSYKVTPRVNLTNFNYEEAIITWQDPNLTLF